MRGGCKALYLYVYRFVSTHFAKEHTYFYVTSPVDNYFLSLQYQLSFSSLSTIIMTFNRSQA